MQNGWVQRVGRRVFVAVGVVALAATTAVTEGGAARGQVAAAAAEGDAGAWVTLVTGDRVLATAEGRVLHVDPGPERDAMTFRSLHDGEETYVIPADAEALVGQDRVDLRLFAVTGLLRHGYGDASREDLPLIITGGAATRSRAAETTELPSIGGVAVQQPKASAVDLWSTLAAPAARAAAAPKVWLDGPVQAALDESVPQVAAPEAWADGHTGQGSLVAVLDTGIDATHPSLDDAVRDAQNFSDSPAGTTDRHGHGTHVASVVTGSGRFQGVAPDAQLLVGKVLGDTGSGLESWVIAGMEWAAAQDADVANMSLGAWVPPGEPSPMDEAVDRLSAESGTLFVASAGNDGPFDGSVGSPATAASALAVGAVDDDDQLADFSSRGIEGQATVKPEITAPGVEIAAARAKGTNLGTPVDETTTRLSGTSMAAPHVAGAAALLAAQHPDWAADRLKAALVGSATPVGEATVHQQGAGRLDVARADRQLVAASPSSLDLGVVPWPHDDDVPVTTTVTYRNDSAIAVDLDLAVTAEDERGEPAVAGMFTLSASQVTVPAGGTATVTLTGDLRVDGPDGRYGGVVEATAAGGLSVRTPFGITKDLETYDVRPEAFDRTGAPTDTSLTFVSLDRQAVVSSYGTEPVRLPAGRYIVMGFLQVDDLTTEVLFDEPAFVVDRDQTLTLDARKAQPVTATIDRRGAGRGFMEAEMNHPTTPVGAVWTSVIAHGQNGTQIMAAPSTTTGGRDVRFAARLLLAKADGNGGFADSPYLYHVQWTAKGGIPRRLTRHVPDHTLARVKSTYASASSIETSGLRDGMVAMTLPDTLQERFSPGYVWPRILDTQSAATSNSSWALARSFEAGRRYVERWNQAVVGPVDAGLPSLSMPPLHPHQIARFSELLFFNVGMFADGSDRWAMPTAAAFVLTLTDETGTTYQGDHSPTGGAFFWGLPDDERTYRMESHATRPDTELSSRIDTAWTFRSSFASGFTPLPLLSVRFAPEVDDHNRAPSGRRFSFPLQLGRHRDASYSDPITITIEASFDDGATWQPAKVRGEGDDRTVTLTHPAGPGFVSLRVKAADAAGTTFEQTIIRAYGLAG